jgi:hypothetical protein
MDSFVERRLTVTHSCIPDLLGNLVIKSFVYIRVPYSARQKEKDHSHPVGNHSQSNTTKRVEAQNRNLHATQANPTQPNQKPLTSS